jgi:hypothetical protein
MRAYVEVDVFGAGVEEKWAMVLLNLELAVVAVVDSPEHSTLIMF